VLYELYELIALQTYFEIKKESLNYTDFAHGLSTDKTKNSTKKSREKWLFLVSLSTYTQYQ